MLGDRFSQHSFAQIPDVNITRSKFDRSYAVKDTFDFDYLIPIFVDEILPGDTCNLNVNTFARLATQKVPIMDNMYVDYFFFFVPNRLIWTNWERFNGAQDDPGDSTNFIIPYTTTTAVTGMAVGTIWDKMGIPTEVPDLQLNVLPLRAYNLIWNQWFRDQNLQDSLVISIDDGPDALAEYTLLKRGKRHDYFTSCLPSPQKGTAVSLPIGTSAPVLGIGKVTNVFAGVTSAAVYESDGTTSSYPVYSLLSDATVDANGAYIVKGTANPGYPNIYADLSLATAATINQLRQALAVQSILELDMRGGTRYVEILQAHFNVTSPDFRLQRPEYLGGGRATINVHTVPQTSPTAGSNPQAQLAAFGTTATSGSQIGFTKSFTEHGYVIGLACARADLTYQQGLNKMWSRSTRFDFFWPKLQELGEQGVLNKEIYATGNATQDALVFGYQERYAEYRFKPSEIHGEFRSTFATPLDMWHLAEEFTALPVLDDVFIVQNTPIDRAIAISGAPHLLFDAWFDYKHARPMLTYSVPSNLGRF